MRKIGRNDPCPCDSGQKYKKCCGPALEGAAWPGTPEALMRSRYSAYVTGDVQHLWRTCHPDCEMVQGMTYEQFHKETSAYCNNIQFTGLSVDATWQEDDEGVARVQFTAHYKFPDQEGSFTELSEFVKPEGKWLYLRGTEAK